MSKYCIGCGILLQNEDKNNLGYVDDLEKEYCRRCFRLKHYHELTKLNVHLTNEQILKSVNKQKGFAFFFVDFLNLSHENIQYYHQIQMPKMFVITKSDIIPKSIYYEKIKMWLKNTYKVEEKIILVSKKTSNKLKEQILNIPYQDIYFLGPTNAGKSSMIESLLAKEGKESSVTISEFPNTTLNFIKIPYFNKLIFDTVGFIEKNRINNIELWKKANPKKEIKPINYPLKENAGLIIEDILRITLNKATNIVWFGSEALKIRKVYSNNQTLYDKEKISFWISKNSNVFIRGIGFIYIKEPCEINIYGVPTDFISITPSFMGG